MKIAVLNNIFYPYSRGGADKISKIIVDSFLDDNNDVFVITTKPKKGIVNSDKYKVYFLYSLFQRLNSIPKFIRLFWHILDVFDFWHFIQIRKILKQEKPDLVITNNLKGLGYLTPLAIKKQKTKHIHILHDIQLIHPSGLMHYEKEFEINSLFSNLYKKINSYLFKKADIIISPSKWLLNFHKKNNFFLESKTLILPNPVNIKKEISISKKNKNTFIYIGEIERHKGVLFLLDTFKEINKKHLKYKIIFIGEGTLAGKLKEASQKYDFLEYLGKQNNQEVLKRIKEAEALIMPSTCYENSPTVIYEAYSQGIPVIASRIGGISEIVHKFGGILFKTKDSQDLIKKIEYFIEHKDSIRIKGDLASLNKENYIKKIKSL
jgi:glycosyltransferase involved in cell wall biosynthesis